MRIRRLTNLGKDLLARWCLDTSLPLASMDSEDYSEWASATWPVIDDNFPIQIAQMTGEDQAESADPRIALFVHKTLVGLSRSEAIDISVWSWLNYRCSNYLNRRWRSESTGKIAQYRVLGYPTRTAIGSLWWIAELFQTATGNREILQELSSWSQAATIMNRWLDSKACRYPQIVSSWWDAIQESPARRSGIHQDLTKLNFLLGPLEPSALSLEAARDIWEEIYRGR